MRDGARPSVPGRLSLLLVVWWSVAACAPASLQRDVLRHDLGRGSRGDIESIIPELLIRAGYTIQQRRDTGSLLSYETAWHVREDGWMGASACFGGPRTTTRKEPLTLRYLLHAHREPLDVKRADEAFRAFGKRGAFELVRAPAKHTAFGIVRKL